MARLALLCSESPISLAVMREIGARGADVYPVVRNPRSFLGASRYCKQALLRPAGSVGEWLPGLLETHEIDRVMAIGEADLLALARIKAAGAPFAIAAPPVEQLETVLDKQALLARAKACGVPVPRSWQPESSGFTLPDEQEPDKQEIAFPLVAKWSDPLAVAERLETHGIALEKVAYIPEAAALGPYLERFDPAGVYPLIQEYCPGTGLGQMFHAVDGRITLRFQHLRLREWPLTGGVSSLCAAVPLSEHAGLRAKSEALLAGLRWTGPAMVEYRWDEATGQARLMEINGRFWGSLPLASAAGVEFGWETYTHAFETAPGGRPQPRYPARIARYMAPEVKTLRDVWRDGDSLGSKLRFTGGFAARFFDPRVRYYVGSIKDPGPLMRELRNLVSRQ